MLGVKVSQSSNKARRRLQIQWQPKHGNTAAQRQGHRMGSTTPVLGGPAVPGSHQDVGVGENPARGRLVAVGPPLLTIPVEDQQMLTRPPK